MFKKWQTWALIAVVILISYVVFSGDVKITNTVGTTTPAPAPAAPVEAAKPIQPMV